jgi:hypothetical protein
MAKAKVRTEHEEQTILMGWVYLTTAMQTDIIKKNVLRWTHAIPNGFYRSPAARAKGQREGVKSGILDICVPAPELKLGVRNSGGYNGLYIELKRKGEKARPTQVEFMDYLELVHYRSSLCFTWMDAAKVIVDHLDLTEYIAIDDDSI